MTRARQQHGFTMIELVMAIFIALIAVGALADLFVNSTHSSLSSQRQLGRLTILEQQMERIRQTVKQYGFSALAMTSAPSAATSSPLPTDPTNPNDFVAGGSCAQTWTVKSSYNDTTESFPSSQRVADSPESLLVNGCTVNGSVVSGGQLAPVQYVDLDTGTTYSSFVSIPTGDPYATIDTYVAQTNTAGCNTSLGSCTGDVRRVILALVLNTQASDVGANYPTYSTTVFANPIASNQSNTASGLKLLGLIT